MKTTNTFLFLYLLVISTQSFAGSDQDAYVDQLFSTLPAACTSANCEAYKEEVNKFKEKLRNINCYKSTLTLGECSQIDFQKEVTKFQDKIGAEFDAPNVSSKIKNDVQYNSIQNRFTAKTQNAPGIRELIPVLDDANIGIHTGKVVNGQIFVDKEIKIDPLGKNPANSSWALTQWKKEHPLMLNSSRRDPILINSSYHDKYLGYPKFEINSPRDPKYGTETSLLIFKDPVNNANVFELVSRNGYLNDVGGSNVFLTGTISNQKDATFTNSINLTFNGKLSRLQAQRFATARKEDPVIASAFSGFTAYYKPPGGGPGTNLFIQINHADSRNQNFVHSACYMNGNNVEIVSVMNTSGDFTGQAAPAESPLVPKRYNLNEYLCRSLSLNYVCPSEYKGAQISTTGDDLSRWTLTGFYTGLETQAARGSGQDGTNVGPLAGTVEAGMQYSNLRVSADTNTKFKSCAEVLNKPEEQTACKKGKFQNGLGRTVEFSCGCGDLPGGVKQENGCFHKEVSGVENDGGQSSSATCKKGNFKTETGKTIEFSCGCGEVVGGVLQKDGCYHKEASVIPDVNQTECKRGFFKNSYGQEIEYSCGCGKLLAGVLQADGCYHRPSLR